MKLIDIIEDFFKHIHPQLAYDIEEITYGKSDSGEEICPCILCTIQNKIKNFIDK